LLRTIFHKLKKIFYKSIYFLNPRQEMSGGGQNQESKILMGYPLEHSHTVREMRELRYTIPYLVFW
jgi:hypothetical protein